MVWVTWKQPHCFVVNTTIYWSLCSQQGWYTVHILSLGNQRGSQWDWPVHANPHCQAGGWCTLWTGTPKRSHVLLNPLRLSTVNFFPSIFLLQNDFLYTGTTAGAGQTALPGLGQLDLLIYWEKRNKQVTLFFDKLPLIHQTSRFVMKVAYIHQMCHKSTIVTQKCQNNIWKWLVSMCK